jgi:hypothetical protein
MSELAENNGTTIKQQSGTRSHGTLRRAQQARGRAEDVYYFLLLAERC